MSSKIGTKFNLRAPHLYNFLGIHMPQTPMLCIHCLKAFFTIILNYATGFQISLNRNSYVIYVPSYKFTIQALVCMYVYIHFLCKLSCKYVHNLNIPYSMLFSLGTNFHEWDDNLRNFILGCCVKFDCGSLLQDLVQA